MTRYNDEVMVASSINYTNWAMERAVNAINKMLGEDCATRHPELIAAYMRTAASMMHARLIAEAIDDLGGAISNLSEPLRSDHPLQGETLGGLSEALQNIATALQKGE
jgi:hypothetical protein